MRLPLCSAAVLMVVHVATASASPLGVPAVDSYTWNNGEARRFELTWNRTQAMATFVIDGLGTSVYGSLDACCGDTFDRIRDVHPGASLTFTDLAINTMSVNTVFYDNLSLTLFRKGALDNLGSLTGLVTLRWDDPYARLTYLMFDPVPTWFEVPGAPAAPPLFVLGAGRHSGEFLPTNTPEPLVTPEPSTITLFGLGLLGLRAAARRKFAAKKTSNQTP